jgi:hypothetical protein
VIFSAQNKKHEMGEWKYLQDEKGNIFFMPDKEEK